MGTSSPSSASLRAEIEQTRRRLSEDLDKLVERVSPRRAADRQRRRLRGTLWNVRSRVTRRG